MHAMWHAKSGFNIDQALAESVAFFTAYQTEATRRVQAQAEVSHNTLDALMEHIPEGITLADAPDVFIRRVSR